MLGADVFLLSVSVYNDRAGATGHYTHPVSAGLAIKCAFGEGNRIMRYIESHNSYKVSVWRPFAFSLNLWFAR